MKKLEKLNNTFWLSRHLKFSKTTVGVIKVRQIIKKTINYRWLKQKVNNSSLTRTIYLDQTKCDYQTLLLTFNLIFGHWNFTREIEEFN